MMRLVIMIGAVCSMMLFSAEGYSQPRTGEKHCMPADDLVAEGKITHLNKRKAVLTGKVENLSGKVEYEDAKIGAELYDKNNKKIGYHEFTVGDDIEVNESETFRVRVRNAENVASVRYIVICANRPVISI